MQGRYNGNSTRNISLATNRIARPNSIEKQMGAIGTGVRRLGRGARGVFYFVPRTPADYAPVDGREPKQGKDAIGGNKMFVVVINGWDYSAVVVAVCDNLERAKELAEKQQQSMTDLPWNGVFVLEASDNELFEFDGLDILYTAEHRVDKQRKE